MLYTALYFNQVFEIPILNNNSSTCKPLCKNIVLLCARKKLNSRLESYPVVRRRRLGRPRNFIIDYFRQVINVLIVIGRGPYALKTQTHRTAGPCKQRTRQISRLSDPTRTASLNQASHHLIIGPINSSWCFYSRAYFSS
jgi:hypothetical protein